MKCVAFGDLVFSRVQNYWVFLQWVWCYSVLKLSCAEAFCGVWSAADLSSPHSNRRPYSLLQWIRYRFRIIIYYAGSERQDVEVEYWGSYFFGDSWWKRTCARENILTRRISKGNYHYSIKHGNTDKNSRSEKAKSEVYWGVVIS